VAARTRSRFGATVTGEIAIAAYERSRGVTCKRGSRG
jgi:hypothetical protein